MHIDRLEAVAVYLISANPLPIRFDFSYYVMGVSDVNPLGTSGDAVGLLPHIFPSYWDVFRKYNVPTVVLKNHESSGFTGDDVMKFFDINEDMYHHLFEPIGQQPEIYGGKMLGEDAKAHEVGQNILEFTKKHEQSLAS